jgi:pimeloyl-ACP methyl ester carboxylesterase
MHFAEQGEGPLVVLLHGWPECWYSWRHQIPALAESGFHVVVPDQRGYGQTDCPEPIEAYTITELTADITGLVQGLGYERATIVGHDFGSVVAWHCALLRPDLFHSLALLSVPYIPRAKHGRKPTEMMKRIAGEKQFYQLLFQEPGIAEAMFEGDVRETMKRLLYSASGDAVPDDKAKFIFDRSDVFLDVLSSPDKLPDWLDEKDLDYYTQMFTTTGFRGGLNWYRNLDRNWELTPFLSGARLTQPTLYLSGEEDDVVILYRRAIKSLKETAPRLWKKVLIPGAGHWVQQEKPQKVNNLLIEFLESVSANSG